MASDPIQTTTVAGWWGRRSADSATIYCTQNGWREATWERHRRKGWREVSATIRPVVGFDAFGQAVLGEPRRVK
jgi:hypothetical protein